MPENETAKEKDILKTPAVEAREMEQLIRRGHSAHAVVGVLTLLGVVVLALGAFFYENYENVFYREAKNEPFSHYLKREMEVQLSQERDFHNVSSTDNVPPAPRWPLDLYRKLRLDMYVLAGLAVLLTLVFIYIERAKGRRNDLLVYRALAREIEKLRQRVKELSDRPKSFPAASPGREPEKDASGPEPGQSH